MSRLIFFGGVVALVVLILLWDRTTLGAKVAKAASVTYIALAIILLIVGLTVHWE